MELDSKDYSFTSISIESSNVTTGNPAFDALTTIWFKYKQPDSFPERSIFFQRFPVTILSFSFLTKVDANFSPESYVSAGEKLLELYGHELVGRPLAQLYPERALTKVYTAYQDAFTDGCPVYHSRKGSTSKGAFEYERLILPLKFDLNSYWATAVIFPKSDESQSAQRWKALIEEGFQGL